MKLLIGFFLVFSALAQNNSQCQQNYIFTNRPQDPTGGNVVVISGGTATSPSFNNINPHCSAWVLTYTSNGFSALSLQIQDALGSDTGPAPYIAWQGLAVTPYGTNPQTTQSGIIAVSGYYPWVNVYLGSSTGIGFVNIHLDGYVNTNQISFRGGGGSTANGGSLPAQATNTIVGNPTNASATPIAIALGLGLGWCGTTPNILPCLNTAIALTIAAAQSGAPIYCSSSNGTTMYTCSLSAAAALTLYTTGQPFLFHNDIATTGSATLNIDSVSQINLKQSDGSTDPGSVLLTGSYSWIVYDGTVFRILGTYPNGFPILQNSKSAAYTTVLLDCGKQIYHPSSDNNARTFTIDSNANVAAPIGCAITFVNDINTLTIAITSDTMYLGGTATTGSRTLVVHGYATALKVGTTEWIISGPGLT